MEFANVDVYSNVTLVDRTTLGGTEITFDHVPLVFAKGQMELTVPMFVAEWLYTASQGDKHKVWTTEGEYTHRFGVKNAPPKLVALCGEHITDCSPIVIDAGAVEGTNIREVRDPGEQVVPQRIDVPRSELTENQSPGRNTGALVGR